MKICFCISGQLRGNLDNLRELKRNIETLPKGIETKVIFSLWDNSGFKITGSRGLHDARRIFNDDVVKLIPYSYYGLDFWKYFSKTYKRLLSSKTFSSYDAIFSIFPKATIDIENEILNLEFSETQEDNNSIKMLYKIWRCNEIKKKIEKTNGEFDCVIRMRPDLKIKIFKSISWQKFKTREIYIYDNEKILNYSDDKISYGNSKILDIYANLFSKSISENKWLGIHKELDQWLNNHKVIQKKLEHIKKIGIEKTDNLVDINDMQGDNKLFDLIIKLNSYENFAFLIEEINKEITKTKDIDEKISLSHFKAQKYIYKNKISEAFNSFIEAEITLIKNIDFNSVRGRFIARIILDYCKKLNITTFEEITERVFKKNKTQHILANLSRMYETDFKIWLYCLKLSKAFQLKEYSILTKKFQFEKLPERFAKLYREEAANIAKKNKPLSNELLLISKKILKEEQLERQ